MGAGASLHRRMLVGRYHLHLFRMFSSGKIDREMLNRKSLEKPVPPEQLHLGIGSAMPEEPGKTA